jgi:hypothetical protein
MTEQKDNKTVTSELEQLKDPREFPERLKPQIDKTWKTVAELRRKLEKAGLLEKAEGWIDEVQAVEYDKFINHDEYRATFFRGKEDYQFQLMIIHRSNNSFGGDTLHQVLEGYKGKRRLSYAKGYTSSSRVRGYFPPLFNIHIDEDGKHNLYLDGYKTPSTRSESSAFISLMFNDVSLICDEILGTIPEATPQPQKTSIRRRLSRLLK